MTYSIPDDGLSSTEGPGQDRIVEVLRNLDRIWRERQRAKRALEESQEQTEPVMETAESREEV